MYEYFTSLKICKKISAFLYLCLGRSVNMNEFLVAWMSKFISSEAVRNVWKIIKSCYPHKPSWVKWPAIGELWCTCSTILILPWQNDIHYDKMSDFRKRMCEVIEMWFQNNNPAFTHVLAVACSGRLVLSVWRSIYKILNIRKKQKYEWSYSCSFLAAGRRFHSYSMTWKNKIQTE